MRRVIGLYTYVCLTTMRRSESTVWGAMRTHHACLNPVYILEASSWQATGNQLYREYKGAAQTTVPVSRILCPPQCSTMLIAHAFTALSLQSKSEAATGVEMHVAEPLAQEALGTS